MASCPRTWWSTYADTHLASAGLVSDRAARRPTRPETSTELVLARGTAC
ncbi:hypothetical protein [Streptomyces sp. TRM68367]|nr:hypothetical protein [Streptomyces sp. TRM68367]MBC9729388.1 hypothetical protein [Streptomyces sp. TRM68367]